MKSYLLAILIICSLISCNTPKQTTLSNRETNTVANDTIRIVNDDLEYEIIIIEPGFNTWLQSTARPEGYYTQSYLENKNRLYVVSWNQRVLNPNRWSSNLYQMQIDYQSGIDYGYEVNYKLYNYFIYFQIKYKQKLAGFIPRI